MDRFSTKATASSECGTAIAVAAIALGTVALLAVSICPDALLFLFPGW